MTIELTDFTALVGRSLVDLGGLEPVIEEARRRAADEHPGSAYTYSTRIRCNAWACSLGLTVPAGVDCGEAAAAIYTAHVAEHADTVLAQRRMELLTCPESLKKFKELGKEGHAYGIRRPGATEVEPARGIVHARVSVMVLNHRNKIRKFEVVSRPTSGDADWTVLGR